MSRALEFVTSLLAEIGLTGLVDIAIMALVIYASLVWLKRTRRAALALTGLLIVAGVYLLARQFDLRLTVAVLQGFFAVILLALVVIFHEELRYVFERIAQFGLGRGRRSPTAGVGGVREPTVILGRTLIDLSRARVGALVVLPVRDVVSRHLEGGEALEGRISDALLKSLFDPHSPGHDGAVIIHEGRVTEFGCRLPLSKDSSQLGGRGTRHAAALGLSERTDAYCFLVSEERGTISLARHGRLRELDGVRELHDTLREYVDEVNPSGTPSRFGFLRRNNREKLIAVALACALWFVLVHESRMGYRTIRVPVELGQLPEGLKVRELQPEFVEITVSAPRRSLYFLGQADVRLNLRTWELEQGLRTLTIGPTDLTLPDGLRLENAKPRQVEVVLESATANGSRR